MHHVLWEHDLNVYEHADEIMICLFQLLMALIAKVQVHIGLRFNGFQVSGGGNNHFPLLY